MGGPRASSDELTVLAVLLGSAGPLDGAEIAEAAGRGLGAVFPVLAGLERRGWIRSHWESALRPGGPRRRAYRPDPDRLAAADVRVAPILASPEPAHRRRPWFVPGWT